MYILTLAEIELLSFTIAGMQLRFGFVLKTAQPVDNPVMFLLLLSSAHRASRPFLLLTSPQQ